MYDQLVFGWSAGKEDRVVKSDLDVLQISMVTRFVYLVFKSTSRLFNRRDCQDSLHMTLFAISAKVPDVLYDILREISKGLPTVFT